MHLDLLLSVDFFHAFLLIVFVNINGKNLGGAEVDAFRETRSVFCTRIPADMYNGGDLRYHFQRYFIFSVLQKQLIIWMRDLLPDYFAVVIKNL